MSYKLSIVKNKMMKRIINILILLCCIASLSSCGNSTEERSRVLKIYNWADYIDEDVLAEFPAWYKEQTGEDIRIIYQVFDINEIMLTKIERRQEDFDVVCPSEYIIERMLPQRPPATHRPQLRPHAGLHPQRVALHSPRAEQDLATGTPDRGLCGALHVGHRWYPLQQKFITAEEADTWDILWDSKTAAKY